MKRFAFFFLLICFLFSATSQSQAQIAFGPKAGVNFSAMTLKSGGLAFDQNNITGFHAGVVAEFGLGGNFALQPGFLFSTKGAGYSVSGLGEAEIKPSYLEVPVNAIYKIGAGPIHVLLMAGPYFGYGIGGTYSFSSMGQSYDEAINYGSGEDNDLKPFDFGVNVGGGVQISRFQIVAQYGLGISNVASVTEDNTEMKNKVISISLAYLFGMK